MPLHLEIVTPEKVAYQDDVDSVQLPGSEGELGVLPHHAPLVSTLGSGEPDDEAAVCGVRPADATRRERPCRDAPGA